MVSELCGRVLLLGAGSKACCHAAAVLYGGARELRLGDGVWQGAPCDERIKAMSTVAAVAKEVDRAAASAASAPLHAKCFGQSTTDHAKKPQNFSSPACMGGEKLVDAI